MSQYFVLIESGRGEFGRAPLLAAAARGLTPVLVARQPELYLSTPDEAEAWSSAVDTVVVADTADSADVLRRLAEVLDLRQVAGVASIIDYFVVTAAEVARRISVPGCNPEAAARARNKLKTRQACSAAGVGQPAHAWVADATDGDSAKTVGYPCVAKPLTEAASIGVKLCRDRSELTEHLRRLTVTETDIRGNNRPAGALVEEFVQGIELSVETVTWNGERHVVGVIDKVLEGAPAFVEVGETFPSALPEPVQAEAVRTALAGLDAIGHDFGFAHVEVIVSRDGGRLVEINARPGGALIGRLIREAHGVDLVDALVRLHTGEPPQLEPTSHEAAASRYLTSQVSGLLVAGRGLESASTLPGVEDVRLYVAPGAAVRRPRSNADVVGHVVVRASHPALAAAWAQVAAHGISLEVHWDESVGDLFYGALK